MAQTFEPVFIGITPGGSEWWARRPGSEAKMRESFDRLWAKFNAKNAPAPTLEEEIAVAEKKYQRARRKVLDLKNRAVRLHNAGKLAGSAWSLPGYMEASEACKRARLNLRKLERKAARLAKKGA
jgi:hypothetical protein